MGKRGRVVRKIAALQPQVGPRPPKVHWLKFHDQADVLRATATSGAVPQAAAPNFALPAAFADRSPDLVGFNEASRLGASIWVLGSACQGAHRSGWRLHDSPVWRRTTYSQDRFEVRRDCAASLSIRAGARIVAHANFIAFQKNSNTKTLR